MAPVNDNLANAQTLAGSSGSVTGTGVDATIDTPFDPIEDWFGLGDGTVWYKFPVPGWTVDSRLSTTVQWDGAGAEFGAFLFEASTYPPTSAGDYTLLAAQSDIDDTFTITYGYGETAPEGDVFYLGFTGIEDTFTIEWERTTLASSTPLVFPTMGTANGICIAFDDEPTEPTPTWTRLDLTLPVQEWSIDRGRQSELDKTGTGTATIKIRDYSGELDPTNSGSQFNGKLNPGKQAAIALYNPVLDDYSTIFRGFISEMLYDVVDASANFIDVTLELVDAFGYLASAEMVPGFHGTTAPVGAENDIFFEGEPTTEKHVNGRIEDALLNVDWDPAMQSIFSGNVTVRKKTYERKDQLLTVLQDAADSEFPGVSNIYVSREGVINFRGRFARFNPGNPTYGIGEWTAGFTAYSSVTPTTIPIATMQFRRSENDIINAAYATWADASEAVIADLLVRDVDSIQAYGWRPVAFEGLLTYQGHDDDDVSTSTPTEMLKFAQYYVGNYKNPRTRITELGFRPQGADGFNAGELWAFLGTVEIGDLITVLSNHPGDGGFAEAYFVEGIRYSADVEGGATFTNVTLELDVSPQAYFNSNPFGVLDSGG